MVDGRDAIAFVTDTSVDGDHRVGYAGCLASRKDALKEIVALEEGWFAFEYGYRVRGGKRGSADLAARVVARGRRRVLRPRARAATSAVADGT